MRGGKNRKKNTRTQTKIFSRFYYLFFYFIFFIREIENFVYIAAADLLVTIQATSTYSQRNEK